jgi:hypothetical protein
MHGCCLRPGHFRATSVSVARYCVRGGNLLSIPQSLFTALHQVLVTIWDANHLFTVPARIRICRKSGHLYVICTIAFGCYFNTGMLSDIYFTLEAHPQSARNTSSRWIYSLCFCLTTGVEPLCYKSEGRGFECRLSHWIFFNFPDPSSHTMALGFNQPLTEINTRRSFWW